MRKAKRELILASFVLSAIAVTLQMVALGTEEWIIAEARLRETSVQASTVAYGLFKGIFKYNVGGFPTAYEISMTCSVPDNVCAYLCGLDASVRENTLARLYNKENIDFDTDCPSVAKSSRVNYNIRSSNNPHYDDYMFINSGMYIAATVFFITSTVFGLIATLLCLWNTTTNPINTYLSIFGIHIYNGITSITITLGIILWGVIYADTLAKNVCIQTTITGAMTSDGYANLGYSFWINIVSLILFIASDVILYVRNHLINCEPKQITIEEVQDPGLILF